MPDAQGVHSLLLFAPTPFPDAWTTKWFNTSHVVLDEFLHSIGHTWPLPWANWPSKLYKYEWTDIQTCIHKVKTLTFVIPFRSWSCIYPPPTLQNHSRVSDPWPTLFSSVKSTGRTKCSWDKFWYLSKIVSAAPCNGRIFYLFISSYHVHLSYLITVLVLSSFLSMAVA